MIQTQRSSQWNAVAGVWLLRCRPGSRGKSSGKSACSRQVGHVLCSFSHDFIHWNTHTHTVTVCMKHLNTHQTNAQKMLWPLCGNCGGTPAHTSPQYSCPHGRWYTDPPCSADSTRTHRLDQLNSIMNSLQQCRCDEHTAGGTIRKTVK